MTLPNPPQVSQAIPNQPFYSPETPATFDLLSGVLTPNIQLVPNPDENGGNGWVRPADWLAMPDISPTEEKFVGLFAVYDLPENFVAVYFEGDYTVDWGDGFIENFNSGETAQHSFQWGETQASTLTSSGYRQVLVSVTPQQGGHLTVLDLSASHSDIIGYAFDNSPAWLELAVSMPYAESGVSIIFNGYMAGIQERYLAITQRVNLINSGGMTDLGYMLYDFGDLRSVSILNAPNAESTEGLFDYCYNLLEVTLPSFPNVTSTRYMFDLCRSLEEVPEIDTPNSEDMVGMFYQCNSLKKISGLNTSSATIMGSMFFGCSSLTKVPEIDTSNVYLMDDMFLGCMSLQKAPEMDTSNVTNMDGMFSGCVSLPSIPQYETSAVTSMYGIFQGSFISKIPALDLSNVVSLNAAFNNRNLQVCSAVGTSVNVSYNQCVLGRQAIVEIFTNLASAPATIDVRNNYGAAELTPQDRAIAVNKGWTVLY